MTRRLTLAFRMLVLPLILSAVAFMSPHDSHAQPNGFSDQLFLGSWTQAVGMTWDAGGRMFVWDKSGKVWIVENGVKLPNPLLDISEEVGNWRDFGMVGFVLDPNFLSNGYIYCQYTVDRHHLMNFGTANYNPNTNDYFSATIGRVTRYTAQANTNFTTVDYGSRKVLIGETKETGVPSLHESHGIGALAFGTDGSLMVATGDGASYSSTDQGSASETYYQQALADGIITASENVGAYRSQQLDSHDGKFLRIDPATGDGLPSNPFYQAANPRSARSRTYSYGLRNPYRLTKKPGTGSHNQADGNPGIFYIGDVGWGQREELNVVDAPGQNFGWPWWEGMTGRGNGYDNATYEPANHERPKVDWRTGTARGLQNGSIYNIGSAQIPGSSFNGNASTGGVWYTGTDFPETWQNTYFHADYGADWIRNFVMNGNDDPIEVRSFKDAGGPIVFVGTHPTEGGIYYVRYPDQIRKISYTGTTNLDPVARLEASIEYGPGPLTVQFTGDQSYDPENAGLTYSWNFGDGGTSSETNPSHTFSGAGAQGFTVTLTVSDPSGKTGQDSKVISINNTPPVINSTSIDNVNTFNPNTGINLNLSANVNDAQSANASLSYEWLYALHHDDHSHIEPAINSATGNIQLSPIGCDGATYWYRITLKVTDPQGLSTVYVKDIFPNCPGTNQSISFANIADRLTSAPPFTPSVSASSGLPVQVVVVSGPAFMNGDLVNLTGQPGEVVLLALQPGNTSFAPATPVYRQFMVSQSVPVSCSATGSISMEQWNNIIGTSLADLPLNTPPSQTSTLSIFEIPVNVADDYGVRVRGYICPPQTGNYTFWISSDDQGALFLSTDNTEANKSQIATVPTWTNSREWNKFPEQQSVPVYLVAGNKYYIEAQMKEGGGGDNLAVGWQLPNGSLERPIQGSRLSPWDGVAPATLQAEMGIAENVGSAWKTISLTKNFDDMVVVATPVLPAASTAPNVVRIRNTGGNSFQMKLQNPSGTSLSGLKVHYLVVEAGVYNTADHGIKMEAYKRTSNQTSNTGNWILGTESPSNSYSSPVVLGQVMTNNDPSWSTFWASNSSVQGNAPSSAANINTGKHVGEDPDQTRSNETLGIIILEAGAGSLDGMGFTAAVGPDIVGGVDGSSGYDYSFSGVAQPGTAILTLTTMAGTDGGWPVLFGNNPVTNGNVKVAVDEDQLSNGERAHTTERLSYIIFNDGVNNPGPQDQTINFPALADKFTTDGAFAINATASSGLPVSFQIVSGPASISGNTITLNGSTGQVTVSASQAGNANWNPASNVNQTFSVIEQPVGGNYCNSTSSQPWVEWIANVNLSNLDNASAKCHNGCGYSDFTNLSATVAKSSSYPLVVTPGLSWDGYNPDLFWRVWIDYNQDGDFTDAGEKVLEANNGNQGASQNISIPNSAIEGTTRMRVSMRRDAYAGPCESYVFGEVEDYSITILPGGNGGSITLTCPGNVSVTAATGASTAPASWSAPTANTTCPTGGLSVSQTAGAASGSNFPIGATTISYQATDDCGNVQNCSFTVTVISGGGGCDNFTAGGAIAGDETHCGNSFNPGIISSTGNPTGGSGATSYRWQLSTGGASGPWTTLVANNSTYDPNSISTTTWYRRQARRANCTAWLSSNVVVKVVDPNCNPGADYCESAASQPWQQWIGNLTFNTIDNDSGKDGYGDYSSLNTNVSQGTSYSISIQPIYSWTHWDEYIRVWIDYNQDGDFTDAGETVLSQVSPAGTDGSAVPPVTGSISIPASAQLGMTRMRVSMKKDAYAGPCENFTFGEVEDYTITIGNGGGGSTTQTLVFNGSRDPAGVLLDWSTNTESTNEYFLLERATDGTHYQELFQVDSEHEDIGVYAYTQLDEDPNPGLNYYRLKVFHVDGSYHYSLPRTVYFSPRERDVLIFPNPATDWLKLSVPFYEGSAGELMIVNNIGQVVYREMIDAIPAEAIEIATNQFANGLYIVTLKVGDYKRMSGQVVINREY